MRQIHIIGGGTVFHVRPHLAIAAPAYGKTVQDIMNVLYQSDFDGIVHAYTTKMAGNRHQVWTARSGVDDDTPRNLETNDDVAKLIDELVLDHASKIIFMPVAMCDFEPRFIYDEALPDVHLSVGRDRPRHTSDAWKGEEGSARMRIALSPADKVIQGIRKFRKDIFLVGFKTTTGASKQDQFDAGLRLLKQSSCNLVLANDLETRVNMVVTPEQAPHYVSTDRHHTIRQLVGMTLQRYKGHFTRSIVDTDGELVAWRSEVVPESLRVVVDHCIKRGAYKPFMGKTVGHFAVRVPTVLGVDHPPTFITSRRGVNFNELDKVGMVVVQADGDDKVIAWGAKPSVGGQSQRIIFANHPDVDCIVHMHVPLRPGHEQHISVRSQEPYECGSHECGQNTSDGLTLQVVDENLKSVKAVMLDKHGPNIVFNKNIDPQTVIDFIERHWDLERSTSEVPS